MAAPNVEELSKMVVVELLRYATHEKKEVSETALNLINEKLDAMSKEIDSIPSRVSQPSTRALASGIRSMSPRLSGEILGKEHPITKKMREVYIKAVKKFEAVVPPPHRPVGIKRCNTIGRTFRHPPPQDKKPPMRRKALSG